MICAWITFEQIARVLHRDGATIVGVDVPQAADSLVALTNELEGDYLALVTLIFGGTSALSSAVQTEADVALGL